MTYGNQLLTPRTLTVLGSCWLVALLVSCAEAPNGSDIEPLETDTGTVTAEPGEDASDADRPPVANGQSPGALDAGSSQEAGAPSSGEGGTGNGEPDAGDPTMDTDAGMSSMPDTGPPPSLDAGTDSGPPPMDASQPVDSAPPPQDTGSQEPPDTGANANVCSATPTYATVTSCAQCTCMKCGNQVHSCYASGDATKDSQCASVQNCAEKAQCVDTDCYCGSDTLCLSPNGACRTQIASAAGTTSALLIANLRRDTSTSIGRAAAIGQCQVANCKSECGL